MKNAIVTGGTSGIGLGVAKMLIAKGYHVICTYVGQKPVGLPNDMELVETDQSDRAEMHRFIDYVKSKYRTIDCIICNAGITIRKSFIETTDKDWDKMMEVAVNSHYIIIRDLYNLIPCNSRIIFTGSQMGLNPHATVLAYGVTKSLFMLWSRIWLKSLMEQGLQLTRLCQALLRLLGRKKNQNRLNKIFTIKQPFIVLLQWMKLLMDLDSV